MYEDVLVLRLNHVVTLRPQARHVTIDIYSVHVLDSLQHRVYHDERTRTANARTANNTKWSSAELQQGTLWNFFAGIKGKSRYDSFYSQINA